ncbi:hypothetical protein [Hydrogenophaga sp.]|uniref:hypothetical protein n=1 Tax=Hydrogenophaga sp. TaxID=1904254 RepID=UPI0025C0625A|nr:hypothetical protein [Hydrogenophaga sp.]MBT9467214.1 hypothetical protein [Hydrogenophaga sp.]
MSDAKPALKVGDTVELVAVAQGFRNGRLVNPGAVFPYTVPAGKDKQPRLPKWTQLADQAAPRKVDRRNGDLKPVDAQAAVRKKASELTGEQQPDAAGGNLA